ncbi:hypothetical protein [Gallintestinimicrobium sp.]|uniref:hypothetical protein n=1 Tax=Gallintestinimicrobium sp. TaxID=2981655 RepID=UPI0039960E4C
MKKITRLFVTAALLIACIVAASLPAHASTDLSECVPLSAVSCWFTDSDGRVYIGLDANTDTTGINYSEQLSDVPDFSAYVYDSVVDLNDVSGFEVQDGVLNLYTENGDCYIWEK